MEISDLVAAKRLLNNPQSDIDCLWNKVALLEGQLHVAIRHIDALQHRVTELERRKKPKT